MELRIRVICFLVGLLAVGYLLPWIYSMVREAGIVKQRKPAISEVIESGMSCGHGCGAIYDGVESGWQPFMVGHPRCPDCTARVLRALSSVPFDDSKLINQDQQSDQKGVR